MSARKLIVISLLGCASVLMLGGCPTDTGSGRLCNQPGPDCATIVTAGLKVLPDRPDLLNPDDIQVLSDTAIQASGAAITPLTDDQAQAVVNVMVANHITTIASLQAVILQAQTNPASVNISAADLAVLIQIATVNLNQS
jgi:hypothetical protein